MLRFSFFLFVVVALVACKKKESEDCSPESRTYQFNNNSQIDTTRWEPNSAYPLLARRNPGTKRVFTYQYLSPVCISMIDGGGFQTLVFEADPNSTSFSYTADDFGDRHCYYTYGNVLYQPDAFVPTAGKIEGTKINERQWSVHIDVTVRNGYQFTAAGIFTIQ